MKIGFSTNYEGPGGARSWIKGFSEYCIKNGHSIRYGYDDSVDIFCSVANLSTENELKSLKAKNIKILQRLGAIYLKYNHPNPLLIERRNNEFKQLISYADEVVYQSEFCKYTLFNSLYNGDPPKGSIIYNCADSSNFSPTGTILNRPIDKKVILAVAYWGTPHTATRSIDILIDILNYYKDQKDIEFWILGRAFPQHEEKLKNCNFPNVGKLDLLNPISHNDMPVLFRTVDMVLHLKAHEACSNSVIETMYTGKPLVGINSGSLPELVKKSALLCDCVEDIDTFPVIKTNDLIEKINLTLSNLKYYSNLMLARSNKFTEDTTYKVYLEKLIALYNS